MKKYFAVLLSVLMVLTLISTGCASKSYGSNDETAVIKRYMKDLEAKNVDDGKRCFPEGLEISLGPMWAPNDDSAYVVAMYHWALDTLTFAEFEDADEAFYEDKYELDCNDVKSCYTTCHYYFGGEGCYGFTFITCEYMGNYYILDVIENGEIE